MVVEEPASMSIISHSSDERHLCFNSRNPAIFPVECPRGCPRRFKTEDSMKRHLFPSTFQSCPIKLSCNTCNSEFASQHQFETHKQICKAPPGILAAPLHEHDVLAPTVGPSGDQATVECKLALVQLGSVLDEFGVRQCAVNGSSEILASDWPSQFDFD